MRAEGFGGKPSSSVAGAASAREALQHCVAHCIALSNPEAVCFIP